MESEKFLSLGLVENDFTLIIKGLEALPEAGVAGQLIADLMLGAAIDKNDPTAMNNFLRDRKADSDRQAREKASMLEDVAVLKGKMILLKRLLIENNLMSEAKDILGGGQSE